MSEAERDGTVPGMHSLDSSEIRVAGFRQIFVWPLALDLAASDDPQDVDTKLAAVIAALGAHPDWVELDDLLDHLEPLGPDGKPLPRNADRQAATYSEFVYFYDFLQRMIYADNRRSGKTAPLHDRPIRLWRHRRVEAVEFTLEFDHGPTKKGPKVYRAAVDRLALYLFDSGAAIVVLELDFGSPPTMVGDKQANGCERPLVLADVLTIVDHLRRVYTPFFDESGAARVPVEFTWRLRDGSNGAIETHVFTPQAVADDFAFVARPLEKVTDRRVAPVAGHWQKILEPLIFAGYGSPAAPIWRHVLDERIPTMSFVSLSGAAKAVGVAIPPDPRGKAWAAEQRADFGLVSRGDWIRLTSADEAGGDPMPYDPEFLETMEREAFYDRFTAGPETTNATRFLFAGYHFAIVGAGNFLDHVIVHHFRRHYFQMVLLANLELASLLVTSSRISEAVARLRRSDDGRGSGNRAHRRFMEELEEISEWFLTFVHRYRFSGVSNQIQPTELYERLRKSMRLESLYEEVKGELEAAVAFNATCEQRRMAASGERLANVATIGAAVGLALTFLGMTPVVDPIRDFYKAQIGAIGGSEKEQTAAQAARDLLGPMLHHDIGLTALTIAGFSGLMLVTLLGFAVVRDFALRRFRLGFPDLTMGVLAFLAVICGMHGLSWLWALIH
jgi:hypothetical protein